MHTPLGIIGCGGHSVHHAHNLNGRFIVCNIWDPDPNAMEKISSIRKSTSLEELLADRHVVAVLIGSPDEHHLSQIKMALEAGKHVFCEKPLLVPGQEISELERLFELARSKNLALTSCHPRRLDRPMIWFRDGMESSGAEFPRRFGKVMSFSFDFSYHEPSNQWKHSRSLLLDHLNHEVDLMNSFFGICGFYAWKLHDSFEHYDVVGKRDDGITFHFKGTRRLKGSTYPEWCRIRFERGEVNIDLMMGIAYIIDHEKGRTEMVPGLSTDYDGRLARVMYNFEFQIEGDSSGYLTEAEMLMNTEVGIVLQNEGIQRINVRR